MGYFICFLFFRSLDWDPVFGALKLTRNLKTINIHSKYSLPVDEQTGIYNYYKLKYDE